MSRDDVRGGDGVRRDDLPGLGARIAAVSPAWGDLIRGRIDGERRVAGVAPVLAAGVEAIREGYLLHAGAPRVLATDTSDDLSLLIGDWCYAAGLCDVIATGDLDAVATLADLIADTAAMALEEHRTDGMPDPRELRWDDAVAQLGPRP